MVRVPNSLSKDVYACLSCTNKLSRALAYLGATFPAFWFVWHHHLAIPKALKNRKSIVFLISQNVPCHALKAFANLIDRVCNFDYGPSPHWCLVRVGPLGSRKKFCRRALSPPDYVFRTDQPPKRQHEAALGACHVALKLRWCWRNQVALPLASSHHRTHTRAAEADCQKHYGLLCFWLRTRNSCKDSDQETLYKASLRNEVSEEAETPMRVWSMGQATSTTGTCARARDRFWSLELVYRWQARSKSLSVKASHVTWRKWQGNLTAPRYGNISNKQFFTCLPTLLENPANDPESITKYLGPYFAQRHELLISRFWLRKQGKLRTANTCLGKVPSDWTRQQLRVSKKPIWHQQSFTGRLISCW